MKEKEVWIEGVQELALLYPEEIRFLSNLVTKTNDKKGIIVDIGTFKGGSSISLAMGIMQAGLKDKVYTVDNYKKFFYDENENTEDDDEWGINGKIRSCFLQNVKTFGLEDYIVPVFADSTEFLKNNTSDIKFMFYDGSIMTNKVKEDLVLMAPKMVAGSYICLHDFHDVEIYGGNVKEAVDEFLIEHPEFAFVGKLGETGIVKKMEETK